MTKTLKTLRSGAAMALGLGLATLATGAMAQSCTVKIGGIFPTSVDWGRPIAETARFAVDQANAGGGVNGCTVDLLLRDSQSDPKVGVDAAKSLVDLDGVKVLLGAVSSGVTMPILTTVAVPADVPQFSCCSAATAFTALAEEGKTKGLWFRTYPTTDVQAAVTAKIVVDQGLKSVAIFYKNDDWGQDYAKLLTSYLDKMGVTVTESIAVNATQPSYRAEVTSALGDAPDGIVGILYPTEATVLIREWLSLGGSQKMVFANGLRSDDFRTAVGDKYLTQAVGMDNAAPRVASADAFVAAYTDHFGAAPNGPGLPNSYDAAMIALLAMQAAGPEASGSDIAAAVAKVTDPAGEPVTADADGFAKAAKILSQGGTVMYQGATGNVVFDANGDVAAPAVMWKFTDSGTEEVSYFTMEDVRALLSGN
ncbi:Leucine-, isoleucine-, valine-, threonine-, and alanine-binding protein precursor (plasmid) [Paracoccaceae bacterium]|nr:Leucine-, isoleucine-, valine-, threonine-, and alanine-binding protein precursor [Paracoccaceae bacterium]